MNPLIKTRSLWLSVSVALTALCFTACSTPDSRIAENPAAFAALTPQQQAMVKAGQVGIGFTADAVKLSLGDPDRVTMRSDASGETQIWHYVYYEDNGVFLYSGYYHRGWRGRGGWGAGPGPLYPYYMDFPNRTVHDRFTVELRNNTVISISREAP